MVCASKAIAKVLKRETTKGLIKGALITGSVTHKNEMFITVSVGYKRDARLYSNAVWNYNSYKPSSSIQVYIEQIEPQPNETALSRRLLDSEAAWRVLADAKLRGLATEGLIEAKIGEGYVVRVLGLIALLPYNLIDESLRTHTLTGLKLMLKVFQLNKLENFIKLSLLEAKKEKPVQRPLTACEEIWGVLKEASETGVILDLCGRAGQLSLQNLLWHNAVELITEAKLGQLIRSQTKRTSAEGVQLTLQDKPTLKSEEQQVAIFSLITLATRKQLTVQTTANTYGVASAEQFNVRNVLEYLEEQQLKPGDVVKTLPIKIDYAGEQTEIDIDIESARHHKYATLNRENTVMGFVKKLRNDSIVIALGDDLRGLIEMDTPQQAIAACAPLKNKLLEFDVIDYDPGSNTLNLQTVLDERATARLVEA